MILPLSLLTTLLLAISQVRAVDTKIQIFEDILCHERISAAGVISGVDGAAWIDRNKDIPGTQAFNFIGHPGSPWCIYSSYKHHGCHFKYREVSKEDVASGCAVLPTGEYTSFRVYPWKCDKDITFDCVE